MEYEIIWKPSYSCLHCKLQSWESMKIEPGSMVSMDPTIQIEGKMNWGILSSLWRMFLTWESFFVSEIVANRENSDIYLAPRSVWDIEMFEVTPGKDWIVQWGWFLACTSEVETNTKFEWLRWFFSGEWLFMIRVSWNGKFWVSSFWAIVEYELKWDEKFIVDNAHIVAFESSLDYNIRNAWSWFFSSVKNWEWLVCEFSWVWKIFFQTRNVGSFSEYLNPFLARASSSQWESSVLGWIFGG